MFKMFQCTTPVLVEVIRTASPGSAPGPEESWWPRNTKYPQSPSPLTLPRQGWSSWIEYQLGEFICFDKLLENIKQLQINYNQTSTGLDMVTLFIKGSLGLVRIELAWECSLSLGSVSLWKFRELRLLSVSSL